MPAHHETQGKKKRASRKTKRCWLTRHQQEEGSEVVVVSFLLVVNTIYMVDTEKRGEFVTPVKGCGGRVAHVLALGTDHLTFVQSLSAFASALSLSLSLSLFLSFSARGDVVVPFWLVVSLFYRVRVFAFYSQPFWCFSPHVVVGIHCDGFRVIEMASEWCSAGVGQERGKKARRGPPPACCLAPFHLLPWSNEGRDGLWMGAYEDRHACKRKCAPLSRAMVGLTCMSDGVGWRCCCCSM